MYEVEPGRVISPNEMKNPNFDLKPRDRGDGKANEQTQPPIKGMSIEEVFSVIKLKPPPKKTWEPDVKAMISTSKWLSTYGLKRNRLTLDQILGTIGFKHSDDFDHALKKPVCSRYGEGMFKRYPKRDGKVYNVNVNVSREKIKQIENSLLQAINLYKRRIDWLTSESRRLLGVIEEHCVCIVIDIKTNSPTLFDHCRNALIRILEEQVSQIAKFNLIRAAQDMVCYNQVAVPVTRDSLDEAGRWIRGLDSVAATTKTSACEAILKATQDRNIECIYLFSEGSSSDTAMELTLQKLKGGPLPVHAVAFNSTNSTTIKFLKDVAMVTGGRFHAFAFNKLDTDVSGTSGYNADNKILHGGVPPGAGSRADVVAMWAELEEARNVLQDVQQIVDEVPDAKETMKAIKQNTETSVPVQRSEQNMSSAEWLSKHGLRSRKLDVYDVLASCSFKHCDGVVDVKKAPYDNYTDADTMNKLVGAKYCDKFCHFQWKDGSIKHVHVTADIHRQYERKMIVALQDFQRRIDWLQQGSRELFGTIIEDQVYILIDVSNSMENHLGLVKEKLFKLMQEQLRHKQRFNLVKFGSRAQPWRDRMLEVNESSLQSAWQWVRDLNVAGSTNTLAALKIALGDTQTQAVYLLSDGRPDHPPKTILAQVQLQRKTPIHTISFNCNDSEANDFLATLAADSGGRYHYYSDDTSFLPAGPVPYESEDVRLLKEEIKKGRDDLTKLGDLREQCALLDWSQNGHDEDGCGKDHGIRKRPSSAVGNQQDAAQILSRDSPRLAPPKSGRPKSAQPWARRTLSSLTASINNTSRRSHDRTTTFPPPPQPFSRSSSKTKPNITYHTKTSWLRLNGSLDGWTLPETRNMLGQQQQRYISAMNDLTKTKEESKKGRRKKKKANSLAMSSRQWLRKHGLAAKKLTIYDALGGSMVRQRAKYVPILEKYVTSQVFNEIMPIAHVTNNKQEVNLINPGAVDLLGYEEKLKAAIKLYNKRLDQVAWNALTPEERDRFGSDVPVSFQENRKDYLLCLEQLGWPISEKDIILLEEEVEKAERFLFQSKSLRHASGTPQSNSEKRTPRLFPNANRSQDTTRDLLEQLENADGSKKGSDSEDEARKDSSDERSAPGSDSEEELEGIKEEDSDSDAGSKVKSDNYSQDEDHFEQEEPSKIKQTKLFKPVSKTKRPTRKSRNLRLNKGMKVIARCMDDGLYYPGVVVKNEDARHVQVKFQALGKLSVASRFVISTSGAKAMPRLKTGDYVLVRGLKGKAEVWVPGIIQFGPKEESKQAKFYTVITYNKHKICVIRSSLMMIAQSRYNFMVRYICSIHQPTQPLLLTANSDGQKPYLSPGDLDESGPNQKYPFLVRPQSSTSEMQTDKPELITTEVQADETSPEEIRGILQDLREQLLKNQEDTYHSQEELKGELKESLKKREELDRMQEELRQRHENLLEEHSNFQRESDRLLSRHNRLKKKHQDLRDRHQKVKSHQEELQQKEKATLQRFEELQGEHSHLKSSFDSLHAEHQDLRDKYKAQEERRNQLTDSGIQTDELLLEAVEEVEEAEKRQDESQEDRKEEKVKDDEKENVEERRSEEHQNSNDGDEKGKEETKEEMMNRPSLIGEEVLAQSPDDGWFYRVTVESVTDDGHCFVADSNDTIQKVEEKWLLTDDDDAQREIQVGDAVVALHPEYPYRYGPALVKQQGANLWYNLVFYDGMVVDAPREEMYYLDKNLYSEVKENILSNEDKWVGHAVVVRNNKNGIYALGTVVERHKRSNHYKIEWADGHLSDQHSQHIFGAFSRRQRMALGDHVLAMNNISKLTYLPGEIVQVNGNKLVVQFVDGRSSNSVDTKQCFWLSEAYYIQAKDFFLDKNSVKGDSSSNSSSDSESSVTSVSSRESKKKQTKKGQGKMKRKSSNSSSSSLSLLD